MNAKYTIGEIVMLNDTPSMFEVLYSFTNGGDGRRIYKLTHIDADHSFVAEEYNIRSINGQLNSMIKQLVAL